MVLLVANAVQPAMTGPDSSLLGGLIIMATLFAANRMIAWLVPRSAALRRLAEGQATIIGRDGAWDRDALAREGLDEAECEMALREHGVADVREVRLAVLETDGTISVVSSNASLRRGRRRVRYRRI